MQQRVQAAGQTKYWTVINAQNRQWSGKAQNRTSKTVEQKSETNVKLNKHKKTSLKRITQSMYFARNKS